MSIRGEGIFTPAGEGSFRVENCLGLLNAGPGIFSAVGGGFFPFGKTGFEQIAHRDIAAKEIHEAGRGFLTSNIFLLFLFRIPRREAQGIFPDEKPSENNQSTNKPI